MLAPKLDKVFSHSFDTLPETAFQMKIALPKPTPIRF